MIISINFSIFTLEQRCFKVPCDNYHQSFSGQVNDMPTPFCSGIMPLGTNDTWTKWKILGSGRF